MLLKTNKLSITLTSKTLCRDLNIMIYPGDTWGILGANGSGKTTLLQTFAGLQPNYQGEIFLREKPLLDYSRKTLAQEIGILFQESSFVFPQTVLAYCENSRYPHGKNILQDDKIIHDALIKMDLMHFGAQNILTLSGGEKRRLAIAALIAQTPTVFFLDEPMNHLDLRYQIIVMEFFKKLSQEKPVGIMMTLHDIQLAKRYCNKILMLFENGKTQQGEAKNLLTAANLQKLYGLSKTQLDSLLNPLAL